MLFEVPVEGKGMDSPTEMWSPSGEETRMDDFRKRINKELKMTLSMYSYLVPCDLWVLACNVVNNNTIP